MAAFLHSDCDNRTDIRKESLCRPFRAITNRNIHQTPAWDKLTGEQREALMVVSQVLPFRVNPYVLEQLIRWEDVPNDPMFQLSFPQRDMLDPEDYDAVLRLLKSNRAEPEKRLALRNAVSRIHARLNPHPAGQMTHNVPVMDGRPLPGIQHKYRETVVFFPQAGQTCHTFCMYCFRWPQSLGDRNLTFAAPDTSELVTYLSRKPDVTDVLVTGGDPMVMRAPVLRSYLEPLLAPALDHVQNIRIGTKALAWWPHRFTTDSDADELLDLFRMVIRSGKRLAIMAHFTHPREFGTETAVRAIRRIQETGVVIRMQSPVVRHVNDSAETWRLLWTEGQALGMVPYYMFVARDTGPKNYYEIPLVRCYEIFRDAFAAIPGLARTARGPSMSAFAGKVLVVGTDVRWLDGQMRPVFVLKYLQARDPDLVGRPFCAPFDPHATWFDELRPARQTDQQFFPHTRVAMDAALLN